MKRGAKFRDNVVDIPETCTSTNATSGAKFPARLALGALGLIVVCGGAYALYNTGQVGGKKSLPPGPRPWAVFGTSMHLGTSPCQAMAKLCTFNYGGIMTIYMGNIPTVIITSSKIAVQVQHQKPFVYF